MAISKKTLYLLSVLLLVLLSIGAQTLVNLTTDVTGLLPIANGGTGAATTDANKIFIGPSSGSGAPSFRIPEPWQFSALPDLSLARLTLWVHQGTSGSAMVGDAITATGSGSQGATSSTLPSYFQSATTTTNGNAATLGGNLNYVVGRNLRFMFLTSQSSTGAQRMWRGLSDQTVATMAASDNPAGNYVEISYCNDGANADCATDDTNWRFKTKDNTTQNNVDTGIAADTNFHAWIIVENPGVNFTLYHATLGGTFSLVATSSSNLPTSGTPLGYTLTTTCMTCNPTVQNYRIARFQIAATF